MLSDRSMWEEVIEGSGLSFGALFDRHRDRVYGHALKISSSRDDAEDLTATAFLELWRKRKSVRLVNNSVLPWMLVVTTNLNRNLSRAQKRYRNVLQNLEREAVDDHETRWDRVVDNPLGDELLSQLGRLRPIDQQLISLTVLEGFSLQESAEVLKLSEAAAKSRIHRARKTLKNSLDDYMRCRNNAIGAS